MGYTGKGIVITILDDGLEKNHPDLEANYVSFVRPPLAPLERTRAKRCSLDNDVVGQPR